MTYGFWIFPRKIQTRKPNSLNVCFQNKQLKLSCQYDDDDLFVLYLSFIFWKKLPLHTFLESTFYVYDQILFIHASNIFISYCNVLWWRYLIRGFGKVSDSCKIVLCIFNPILWLKEASTTSIYLLTYMGVFPATMYPNSSATKRHRPKTRKSFWSPTKCV